MNKQFGKKKLIKDISANSIQTLSTQFFGLLIFYLMSKYLSKEVFGEFNWSMALGSTMIAIASFGLDTVFVKRIAAGENKQLISGLHFFHTLAAGFLLSLTLLFVWLFVPSFTHKHPLFFFVFISLALNNIVNSLRLYLNGLESYKQLATLTFLANAVKLLLIIALFAAGHFNIVTLVCSYMITSIFEFGLAYFFIVKATSYGVRPLLKQLEYKQFILQSLPQLGVVIFDSALARIDWILLGELSSTQATADYSFTYKIFELSKLPILIIAPVLLTRFSKIFSSQNGPDLKQKTEIELFLKLELFVVMIIPLILVSCWAPVMDYFTNGKYGNVNETNYSILAFCVPLSCLINFLWTLAFVQARLKEIMFITIACSALNIVANAILIPFYGGLGASLAFLFSTLIQLILYLIFTKQNKVSLSYKNFILSFFNAVLAVSIVKSVAVSVILAPLAVVGIYLILALVTKQVSIYEARQLLNKKKIQV
jgi:O-antigen/teichoic acid export membrane protein